MFCSPQLQWKEPNTYCYQPTCISTLKRNPGPLSTLRGHTIPPCDSSMLLFTLQPAEGATVPLVSWNSTQPEHKRAGQVGENFRVQGGKSVAVQNYFLERMQTIKNPRCQGAESVSVQPDQVEWFEMIKCSWPNVSNLVALETKLLKILESNKCRLGNRWNSVLTKENILQWTHPSEGCIQNTGNLIIGQQQVSALRQVAEDSRGDGCDGVVMKINLQSFSINVMWHFSEAPVCSVELPVQCVLISACILVCTGSIYPFKDDNQKYHWKKIKHRLLQLLGCKTILFILVWGRTIKLNDQVWDN